MTIARPRKILLVGVVVAVVAVVVRLFRGRSAPALAPGAAPTRPWPELRPEPLTPEDAPDWTGPAATLTDAGPLAADPSDDGTEPPPASPAAEPRWAEVVDGRCPETHPVKAKMSSGIYHLPGMLNYERARPDRCYRTAADAEADGLRAAKR